MQQSEDSPGSEKLQASGAPAVDSDENRVKTTPLRFRSDRLEGTGPDHLRDHFLAPRFEPLAKPDLERRTGLLSSIARVALKPETGSMGVAGKFDGAAAHTADPGGVIVEITNDFPDRHARLLEYGTLIGRRHDKSPRA